jgi:rsbT co-antagonist protein RsbR
MTTTSLGRDPGPFFAASGTPLAVLARDGTIVAANGAFGKAFSKSGDVVGCPLSSLARAADQERVRQAVDASVHADAREVGHSFDVMADTASAGSFVRSMRVHLTGLPEGEILVTAVPSPPGRPDDEMRLAVLDRILESGPVGYFAMDAKGTYTSNEGKAGERLGIAAGALVGKNSLEMWKDTPSYDDMVRSLKGEEVHIQTSMPGIDVEMWYLPVLDASGRPDGAVGFVIDQTPQRDAERAVREKLDVIEKQNSTLQMLSKVLASAPLMIWSTDEAGRITTSEGRGLEVLGFTSSDLVGLNALELYKEQPDIAGAIVRALAGDESRAMTKPAPGVYFDSWFMPLRGNDGVLQGAIGLAIDSSERVKGENDLREKLELIERQSATIRALATPIIKVWDEVLCLPVIGTVDSARTADMMQALMEAIVREQAQFAIIDLTGVEVVDTSTADHLIQLFRAARVLGVEGVLCGIRPAVAQTVVALGLDLGAVKTMRSLRDALRWCIRVRVEPHARSAAGAPAAPHAHGNGHGNGALPPRRSAS